MVALVYVDIDQDIHKVSPNEKPIKLLGFSFYTGNHSKFCSISSGKKVDHRVIDHTCLK